MVMPSVLIIEDDDDSRRAIAKLFERADWKVLEAADGDAGVRPLIDFYPRFHVRQRSRNYRRNWVRSRLD